MAEKAKLIFFCGKMGAGKTTKASEVAWLTSAVLISEDAWLAALYPEEINSVSDYVKYSNRFKQALKTHVQCLLKSGLNVVLDFPGNTLSQRAWFKEILEGYEFAHELIYLDAEDEICLTRLQRRRLEQPERIRFDTEEVFHMMSHYFQPPTAGEGLNIKTIKVLTA